MHLRYILHKMRDGNKRIICPKHDLAVCIIAGTYVSLMHSGKKYRRISAPRFSIHDNLSARHGNIVQLHRHVQKHFPIFQPATLDATLGISTCRYVSSVDGVSVRSLKYVGRYFVLSNIDVRVFSSYPSSSGRRPISILGPILRHLSQTQKFRV